MKFEPRFKHLEKRSPEEESARKSEYEKHKRI